MRYPKEHKKQARQHLVDSGARLAKKRGFAAAGVGDMAAASGVTSGAVYKHSYALSSTVLPVVQKTKVPVVVLNLQPVGRIDYESFNNLPSREEKTGEWLGYCQACSVPEIASVFNRAGIDYHLVTGTLDDPEAWSEIKDWVDAAYVARVFRQTRIGLMGTYYAGMLDVYSDYTQLASVFGNNFDLVEIDELKALRDAATDQDVDEMLTNFHTTFEVSSDCSEAELRRAARTSVGLKRLVEKHRLGVRSSRRTWMCRDYRYDIWGIS